MKVDELKVGLVCKNYLLRTYNILYVLYRQHYINNNDE
jgi:hypothetical protein